LDPSITFQSGMEKSEQQVMSKILKVKEGQRYAQRPGAHCPATVWQVGAVRQDAVPVPHARLVRLDDPLQTKTISCATLADPTFYELIGDIPSHSGA